ncbi:MAG: hypothetical protein AVDCRST_MAG07-2578, partial [uncultured Frankineae bacterium]
ERRPGDRRSLRLRRGGLPPARPARRPGRPVRRRRGRRAARGRRARGDLPALRRLGRRPGRGDHRGGRAGARRARPGVPQRGGVDRLRDRRGLRPREVPAGDGDQPRRRRLRRPRGAPRAAPAGRRVDRGDGVDGRSDRHAVRPGVRRQQARRRGARAGARAGTAAAGDPDQRLLPGVRRDEDHLGHQVDAGRQRCPDHPGRGRRGGGPAGVRLLRDRPGVAAAGRARRHALPVPRHPRAAGRRRGEGRTGRPDRCPDRHGRTAACVL